MILNVTNTPFHSFTNGARIACRGEEVVSQYVETIEEFESLYGMYQDITAVIVDPEYIVLNNDILNYVDCKVVTLLFETIVDTGEYYLLEYDVQEY